MPIQSQPFPGTLRLLGVQVQAHFGPAWIVKVRVTQQYLEVVHSGDSNNKVRVSQQYTEVVHSGDANTKTRVSQQYLEVVHTFILPPPIIGPGKSDTAKAHSPGQQKKVEAEKFRLGLVKLRSDDRNFRGDRSGGSIVFAYPREFTPNNPELVFKRHVTRILHRSR